MSNSKVHESRENGKDQRRRKSRNSRVGVSLFLRKLLTRYSLHYQLERNVWSLLSFTFLPSKPRVRVPLEKPILRLEAFYHVVDYRVLKYGHHSNFLYGNIPHNSSYLHSAPGVDRLFSPDISSFGLMVHLNNFKEKTTFGRPELVYKYKFIIPTTSNSIRKFRSCFYMEHEDGAKNSVCFLAVSSSLLALKECSHE